MHCRRGSQNPKLPPPISSSVTVTITIPLLRVNNQWGSDSRPINGKLCRRRGGQGTINRPDGAIGLDGPGPCIRYDWRLPIIVADREPCKDTFYCGESGSP